LTPGHEDNTRIQLVLLSAPFPLLLSEKVGQCSVGFLIGTESNMAAILFRTFLVIFWVRLTQATDTLLSPKGVNYEGMTFELHFQFKMIQHCTSM
jgi:hypothetical protein